MTLREALAQAGSLPARVQCCWEFITDHEFGIFSYTIISTTGQAAYGYSGDDPLTGTPVAFKLDTSGFSIISHDIADLRRELEILKQRKAEIALKLQQLFA